MKNNKGIFLFLPLLKYFSNENIIIQHKGFLFSNDDILKDLTWIHNFSPLESSDLKVIISRKDLKWKINNDELYYPIFPPFNSKYYENYLKIINITGSQINLFVYDDDSYNKIKNNSLLIKGFYFVGLPDILEDYIKKANWKIDSYLNGGNYHDYMDLLTYIYDIGIIYKFLKLEKYLESKLYIIIDFFKLVEKSFCENNYACGISGNNNINSKYVGIARFLDRDNLKIKKEYYNIFNKGDIIIANNTSVHFMGYILKAGGIITINNNKLSHASIISRELNIPLVLGIRDLFFKIFDGDMIELDSVTGEIKVLKRFWELS